MKIDKYKVIVEFDLAVLSGVDRSERIVGDLNQLFHDMVKLWAKDKQAIVTATKTTLDGEQT
jgi:hypothetical protein